MALVLMTLEPGAVSCGRTPALSRAGRPRRFRSSEWLRGPRRLPQLVRRFIVRGHTQHRTSHWPARRIRSDHRETQWRAKPKWGSVRVRRKELRGTVYL